MRLSLEDWPRLLDWTGRQLRRDKRGFGQVVGRVEQLARAAAQMGLRSVKGVTSAGESFK